MRKKLKVCAIILLISALLYLVYIFIVNSILSPVFSENYLSQEEIFNTVMKNTELLNQVPNEIKNIESTSFYINTKKNYVTSYFSVFLSPFNNKVIVTPVDNNNLSKKNPYLVFKSNVLYRIFKIEGIQEIEIYYSESSRMCILFDCGYQSYMSRYYGFYYTEDNQPIGWEGTDVNFKQDGNRWTYKDIANYGAIYITQKITDNWFYFEMH